MITTGFTGMLLVMVPCKSKSQSAELKAAIKFTDNEQYEKASSAFKALVAKDPANAENWFYFGENLFAAEKTDSAEVLYKKGWETNNKMPLNQIGLAKIQMSKGKTADAQTGIDAALNLFNEKGVKIKEEMKVRSYVEAAEALIEGPAKNTTKALDYAGKALAIDEKNIPAYIVKGDALFIADPLNATPSIEAYKQAIMLDMASPLAYSKLAYMYYRGGQNLFPKAIENYTEAIKRDANFAPAYIGRADAYYYSNKSDEAINDAKKYLELNKGNITAQKRYIGFLIAAKRYDEASTEVTKLEKMIGAQDPILNRLKGYVLYEKGDYKNALDAMTFFVTNYPQKDKINTTDYEYIGRIHGKMSNDSLMGYYFEKSISADPKNKMGLATEMIAFYKEKKNNKKQVQWYKKKIKYGSKDVNDWYYMGLAAYYADDCGACDTAFTEYVKSQPDFALAHYYLGWAKDCQDKSEPKAWTAKQAYETFLAKLKPEEMEKQNKKVSEAYFYLARYYYFSETKDYALSKCYATKVVTLNASESWVKSATDFMKYKEITAATASPDCK